METEGIRWLLKAGWSWAIMLRGDTELHATPDGINKTASHKFR